MELALSGHSPAVGASRIVAAATKPKGAKGTGKAKKAKPAAAPLGPTGHVPPGTVVHFVDGGFIGAAAAGRGQTAHKTPKKIASKAPPPAPKPAKAAKAPHALTFTAMGPGRAVGISANGKEIFAEIEFAMSLSLGDKCIRVDGHVVHTYKSADRIAIGGLTAQGGIMNLN